MNRQELFELFELELEKMNRPFTVLKGSLKDRQNVVKVTLEKVQKP
jgi:hypothetical protein